MKDVYTDCQERMAGQSKLELFRDYNDYLEPDQVREFIGYCESQIEQGEIYEPGSYLYEWFSDHQTYDWFRDYEYEHFRDTFLNPFLEEHPEYEDKEDIVDECLRNLMYEMDLYDADMDHFDKEYNFYLLTDPEKTFELYDEQIPFVEYKHKYLRLLQRSQGWTNNSQSMKELIHSGGYNGLGICIMLNTSLFDMVRIMQAKQLTVKAGSEVYMFNPYIGTGGDTTELTSDWTFRLNINEIGFGVDCSRRGPRGYTPEEVYGWYHPAFDKNKVTFKSLRQ